MADSITKVRAGGAGSSIGTFLPVYWDSVLGENLYPNLVFYSYGTKRQIPRNFGFTIKIPRLKRRTGVVAARVYSGATSTAEGSVPASCAVTTEYVSGILKQFAGVYKHSDLVVMTAMSDVVMLSLKEIARDLALQMDTHIRDQISGTGATVFGAGTQALTCGTTFGILRATHFLKASAILDGQNNPRPAGGHYPAVIHPFQQWDLQAVTSSNAWLDINKYKGSEEPENLYRAELGRIFGCAITTSTNIVRVTAANSDHGGLKQFGTTNSASSSGWQDMVFAPEAYYVTEISDLTAKTYVKQLGSGGTSDPVNQIATVGAKVFFTAIPASYVSTEYRMVRINAVGARL